MVAASSAIRSRMCGVEQKRDNHSQGEAPCAPGGNSSLKNRYVIRGNIFLHIERSLWQDESGTMGKHSRELAKVLRRPGSQRCARGLRGLIVWHDLRVTC